MNINDIGHLYVGFNVDEDFRVLIRASDINTAYNIAEEYRIDSNMQGFFQLKSYQNEKIRFDCDYILE